MDRFDSVLNCIAVRVLLALALVSLTLPAVALADCRADYDTAVGIVQEVLAGLDKQQATDNQDFESRYSIVVKRMVANRCEKELMDLFQFAQDEKQKRESLPGNSSHP